MVVLSAACCGAFQLIAPTEGQAVRENIKIQLPASAVPDSGFISVLAGETGAEKFVVAISRDSAKLVNGNLTFYWNSKAPYFESKDLMTPLYFKDGRYPITVEVHDAKGKMVESGTTKIELKNRVPRTNPAPGVSLANKLAFGQINSYRVHSDESTFEMVNGIGLALFGGMALSADAVITQSVEDVRPGGEFLLRLREDENAYISSYGVKRFVYADDPLKPQLYRLVSKYGKVLTANLFAKQARFQIMDILPTLPAKSVKEGDSWPDSMSLKIDGLTPLIKLKGSAMLDSFEWQNGRECAKITSRLSGEAQLMLANGKIRGKGPVSADVTTYFAYKTGMMLQRDIRFYFDATVMPGAGDVTADASGGAPGMPGPPSLATSPYGDDPSQDAPVYTPPRTGAPGGYPSGGYQPGGMGNQSTEPSGNKNGRVEFNIVVRLEK